MVRTYSSALALFFLALAGPTGWGAPSETGGEPIRLGMSTALTGPAAQLGLNMRAGVLAALEEANRAGGIGGRRLELISLDDGYEPARTVPNMYALIDDHDVLAIVGNVGTPTSVAAIPIANQRKVLMVGTYSGAGVLRRDPPDRFVVNYRASYAQETAAMVDGLILEAGLLPTEIAFFTQRDAYGDAGFVGGLAALKRHGLRDEFAIPHGRYERNTDAVENALADILGSRSPVRAVIMVGAYEPCARFIQLATEYALDAHFLNVSFVGTSPLIEALGPDAEGVIVTQVVPPIEAELPIVTDHRNAMAASGATEPETYGSLEGYIVGRILLRAMGTLPAPPTRASLADALAALGTFDIGLGLELSLGPGDHQACDHVWPTIIRGGKVVPLDWAALRAPP